MKFADRFNNHFLELYFWYFTQKYRCSVDDVLSTALNEGTYNSG